MNKSLFVNFMEKRFGSFNPDEGYHIEWRNRFNQYPIEKLFSYMDFDSRKILLNLLSNFLK